MTFEEFQATRTFTPCLADMLNDGCYEHIAGYVYADSFYIEQRSGYVHHANGIDSVLSEDYELTIGRESWVDDDLEQLERILWDTFAQEQIAAEESAYTLGA